MAQNSKKTHFAIIAVPIIAIVLLVAGIVLYTQSAFNSINQGQNLHPSGPMSFDVSVVANGISTYNSGALLAPYAVATYHTNNVSFFGMYLGVYSRNPLPNIYYLNTTNYCYQCYSDQALLANVSFYLRKLGMISQSNTFSYVKPSQLNSLPHNSIIIVPSGLIPIYMLPNSAYPINGSASILELLNRSDTIFYIGTNFTESSGPGGVIFSNSNTFLLDHVGLATLPFPNVNTSGVKSNFKNPTFGFAIGGYHGDASYVNTYNGSVVAFTNTQKQGWSNSSALASDIASFMSNRFWLTPLSSGIFVRGSASNGTVGIVGFNTTIQNNKSTEFSQVGSAYGLLVAGAYNSTSVLENDIPIKINIAENGTLSIPPYIGQAQNVEVRVQINVNSTIPLPVQPHIDIYTKNLTYVTGIPIPFFNTTSNIDVIKHSTFPLPSGTYIGILRNFYNKYYSSAIFNITQVSMTPISLGFKNGTFVFYVASNNQAITNASYSMALNGAYKTSGNITNGVITYSLPKGTVVGYGTETFTLQMFGSSYTYTAQNVQKVLNIPTIYIEFAIAILAIVILNIIVKPPNRDEYYIDVPEFQQAKKIDVKVNRNEVISVFDKVNFVYHWKYMPLTLEEIKSGISNNIRYNNIPVSITLQNVALVMSKLALDGDIVSSSGYYAPKRWTVESGYSAEYLATFRRIRDYSVGHAILFTDIGASDIADMILSKSGSQARVVIYTSDSKMRKIDASSDQKTYVVFTDEEKLLEFADKLYKSYGSASEMLKIGISYGYVRLIDATNLDQIVF